MRLIDLRPFPPVERFLNDPMASMRQGWDHINVLITAYFVPILCVALAGTVVCVLARTGLLRWRHSRLTAHARVVEITPPPSVDMAGAEALWTHLLGLLRPAGCVPSPECPTSPGSTSSPQPGCSSGCGFREWSRPGWSSEPSKERGRERGPYEQRTEPLRP
jgi:hypothetical protein